MKPAHNKLCQGFSLFILIFSLSACLNNTDKGVHNSNNKVKNDSSGYNGVFKSYRGSFVNGVFDVNNLKYLLTENGQSHISFIEKPGYTGETKIHLVAEYITRSGNKKYITGKTILPSANLKY